MSNDFLSVIEKSRRECLDRIEAEKRKLSEQYFTPFRISHLMAGMFSAVASNEKLSVLDPCCGVGNLAAAVLKRSDYSSAVADCLLIERDNSLACVAAENFKAEGSVSVIANDFFQVYDELKFYDRIIINPPYAKILNKDPVYKTLKERLGYGETNLYTAFLACCLGRLSECGELVAIIPRSFCNGPMFKGFRKYLLGSFYINEIYLFESRELFSESGVLQEVLLLKVSRAPCEQVLVSHESKDGLVKTREVPISLICFEGDLQSFIHVPLMEGDENLLSKVSRYTDTLLSLGFRASTGKVVDFRSLEYLSDVDGPDKTYLLYQHSVTLGGGLNFKTGVSAKPGYINVSFGSRSRLLDSGNFVVVRRISFKESRTRIVAAPLLKKAINRSCIALDNHLNYIWGESERLDEDLSKSIYAYLSTSTIDKFIRRFSGHTQINATDLNSLPIPSIEMLKSFYRINSGAQLDVLPELAEEFFFG
ncbi:Eco57I restriction-modification methylase domain-containing protein [Pseudomonas sp. LAIL14HWK12:I7]|uniref:Eco57I restriction-modification methylase domain-containing protein n=1 Tax=Pseudomonas sp. LAIL14HWK12:I7 TaxID=1259801 RepID=UPI0015A50207|nr:N-6 DNA methylase [Pseudomonas sp. LAIL14HWK12:I7]